MDILNKLDDRMVKAVHLIRDAAENGRLIILRHHADCDGYAAALCLEEVLLPIISKRTERVWKYYKRFPMKTPFYDYGDALKDLSYFKESMKFGKRPLLVMLDNGCGEEDLLPLRRVKEYKVDIVIVDHHVFSDEVDKLVDCHVNPRVVGGDGTVTTGIMAFEMSKQLGNPDPIYPAVSAVSDHSTDELKAKYAKLAGKDNDYLGKLARCVDFEAHALRFSDSDLIYDLFKKPNTLELVLPEVDAKIAAYEPVVKKFTKRSGKLAVIDLDKAALYGQFPSAGRVVGVAHRLTKDPHITLGLADNFISFRVDGLKFSISKLLSTLKKNVPHGNVSGGGHDMAGTVKFVPGVRDEVLTEIKKLITSK